MPRREVAVKVLLADRISSTAAEEFADEANVMAVLRRIPQSSPSIRPASPATAGHIW